MGSYAEGVQVERSWEWPPGYRIGSCLAPLLIGAVTASLVVPAVAAFDLVLGLPPRQVTDFFSIFFSMTIAVAAFFWSVVLIVPAIHWMLLLGIRFDGIARPGWSLISFGLRNGLHAMAEAVALPVIRNTWLIVIYFRLMGAQVGPHCYIGTTKISEPQLVTIGRGVFLGHNVTITGHLAERGGVQYAPVRIEDGASVGNDVSIMPGCLLEQRVTVAASTFVPKGRVLGQGRLYAGIPAKEVLPPNPNTDGRIAT